MLPSSYIPRPASFRSRRFSSPQAMDIMVSVVLLVVMFYMAVRQEKWIAEGPDMQLPASSGACYRMVGNDITVHLDAHNRLSLSVSAPRIQKELIQQVAARHHVSFTPAQLSRLSGLPLLNQDIQQLPAWLDAPGREQMSNGISAEPSHDQLSEYLTASLKIDPRIYVKLRADQSLSTAQVKRVFRLFQQLGIKSIMLVTETRQSLKVIHLPNGHARYTYF